MPRAASTSDESTTMATRRRIRERAANEPGDSRCRQLGPVEEAMERSPNLVVEIDQSGRPVRRGGRGQALHLDQEVAFPGVAFEGLQRVDAQAGKVSIHLVLGHRPE